MDCTDARMLLSAALDGEAAEADGARLRDHLAGCGRCRAYATDAEALHRMVRIAPAPPVPDLTASILAATAEPPASPAGAPIRIALVGVAVVLLLLSLPSLFSSSEHT